MEKIKTVSEKPIAVRMHEKDNVLVIASDSGAKTGTILYDGTELVDDVPYGHKVTTTDIAEGAPIIRYGETIGFASEFLPCGSWVNESRTTLPDAISLTEGFPEHKIRKVDSEPLEGYTFEGYRNADGSVGTRNILGISMSVHCVSGIADFVVKRIKNELLPKYPNVDDVVALNHHYGCGVAINALMATVPIKTLQNIAKNPNFGGEVMVLSLGCEKLRPERLIPEKQSGQPEDIILTMQDPAYAGFQAMVDEMLERAERHLAKLNQRKRETVPVSELVVGMQCGGSDALSGITANPALGFASDLLVRAGATVMFSEVSEVRDGAALLASRAETPEVANALIEQLTWYDEYLKAGGVDRSANTTPGNKQGGLNNIVEKALGSIVKSGCMPIADVVAPGDRVVKRGLNFAATPASDFICGTLQLAAGMNLHIFTTGRGTPYGLAMAPVIKVATNSGLARRWFDLIDLDAGTIVSEGESIESMGWKLFHLMIDVASGKEKVAAEKLGLTNDLVLFNPAPVT